MRKLIGITSLFLGLLLFSIYFIYEVYVISPEQDFDNKLCHLATIGFSGEIEKICINNGRSFKINLADFTSEKREKMEKIQAIFTFISEMHNDIDRIDEISFASLPPDTKYFSPEYIYFRTSNSSCRLSRRVKKLFGFKVPKRSEGWKFIRLDKNEPIIDNKAHAL